MLEHCSQLFALCSFLKLPWKPFKFSNFFLNKKLSNLKFFFLFEATTTTKM